jgi:hypothetical protein
MKANKKTLMAVKKFLSEEQEYYDLEEMISEMVAETKLLKHESIGEHGIDMDECSIMWGKDDICCLDDFVKSYSDIFIEKICNILDSFVGDDIDCYFEDEAGEVEMSRDVPNGSTQNKQKD